MQNDEHVFETVRTKSVEKTSNSQTKFYTVLTASKSCLTHGLLPKSCIQQATSNSSLFFKLEDKDSASPKLCSAGTKIDMPSPQKHMLVSKGEILALYRLHNNLMKLNIIGSEAICIVQLTATAKLDGRPHLLFYGDFPPTDYLKCLMSYVCKCVYAFICIQMPFALYIQSKFMTGTLTTAHSPRTPLFVTTAWT
uniref:Uncharacterized protein n=1 Tax=Glossina pallidipes TaxID=7398 RepID=A0A1B0AFG0_GLOPL